MTEWRSFRPDPPPPHPFAHWVDGEGWLMMVAAGHDAATGRLGADAAAQTTIAVETIRRDLEANGSSLSEVVFLRLYMRDRDDMAAVMAVLGATLPDPKPPRSAVVFCGLIHPDMRVELEIVARRGHRAV